MTVPRVIALVVGAYYVILGLWSFVAPGQFFLDIASFPPYNRHLLHDVGAFQVGLGAALILPALLRTQLRPSLVAVLAASILHLVSHLEDLQLGGNPSLDLPVLTLLCVLLGLALMAGPVTRRRSAERG